MATKQPFLSLSLSLSCSFNATKHSSSLSNNGIFLLILSLLSHTIWFNTLFIFSIIYFFLLTSSCNIWRALWDPLLGYIFFFLPNLGCSLIFLVHISLTWADHAKEIMRLGILIFYRSAFTCPHFFLIYFIFFLLFILSFFCDGQSVRMHRGQVTDRITSEGSDRVSWTNYALKLWHQWSPLILNYSTLLVSCN